MQGLFLCLEGAKRSFCAALMRPPKAETIACVLSSYTWLKFIQMMGLRFQKGVSDRKRDQGRREREGESGKESGS